MIYLIIISVIAVLVTVYDKIASKYIRRARVSEAMLLLVAVAGGSVAMLLTMLTVRHKTRKYKFMIGIPLIIILQAVVIVILKNLGLIGQYPEKRTLK